MKGLLLNNYYSMAENIKLSVVCVAILAMIALMVGEAIAVVMVAVTIFIFPVNIGSSLQTDESAKWNKFELTTPVRRAQIIQAKYLSYLVMVAIGVACAAVLMGLLVVMNRAPEMSEMGYGFFYGLNLAMFSGVFLYPLLLCFGAMKSELCIIIAAALGAVVMMGIWVAAWLMLLSLGMTVPYRSPQAGLAVVAAAAFLLMLSYGVSVWLYKRKEF